MTPLNDDPMMLTPKPFLIFACVGLVPIALSYGLAPVQSMQALYGLDASPLNLTHILRAVMCLYLALALFWFIAANKPSLQRPALYSLVVFMLGLASGRVLSLLLDGTPHMLLVIFLFLELGFGAVGISLIRNIEKTGE